MRRRHRSAIERNGCNRFARHDSIAQLAQTGHRNRTIG